MANRVMTDGGATLDRWTMDKIRALLPAVATLHPDAGDILGVLARELLSIIPAPYVSPSPPAYIEPLPRPAQPKG